MVGLADSNAILDRERLLAQHQAALTLLQRLLADPAVVRLSWLDLACGKGQIIAHLDENLEVAPRGKIGYVGYDLNVQYGRLTEQRATHLGFRDARVEVGDLANFHHLLDSALSFDFITLTNTIHEIEPSSLSTILFDCLHRLTPDGSLFIYDMESLPSPELGAVPWKGAEFAAIIEALLQGIGVTGYIPPIGRWSHRTCKGWNAQVEKRHVLREVEHIETRRNEAVAAATKKIIEILDRRERECQSALESLTRFGSATGNESAEEIAALYEYWALQRALRRTR